MEIDSKTVCQTALRIITLPVEFANMVLKGVTKGHGGTKEATLNCQMRNEYNYLESPIQG